MGRNPLRHLHLGLISVISPPVDVSTLGARMPRADGSVQAPLLSLPRAPQPRAEDARQLCTWMAWIRRLCCLAVLQSLVAVVDFVLQSKCACTFRDNMAASGQTLHQLVTKDKEACCDSCAIASECTAATFYAVPTSGNSTLCPPAATFLGCCIAEHPAPCNCVLVNGTTDLVHADKSLGCVPRRVVTEDTAREWMDNLLAESPMWLRGALLTATLSWLCRKISGFERSDANPVMAMIGFRGSQRPLGWDELVGSQSVWKLLPIGHAVPDSCSAAPSWYEACEATGLTARQAASVAAAKLLLWHLSQPVGFMVALWVSSCQIGYHQRQIASYVAAREILYVALVFMATYRYPAFLLLNLRSTLSARTHWGHRLAQLCTYTFAPHHYATLCVWYCGAVGNETAQVLLLFQFVSDCFGLCALGLFLRVEVEPPPAAILVGYTITAVGFGFVAVIAVLVCGAYALDAALGWRQRIGFGVCAVAALGLLTVISWFYLFVPLWPH
eukprot:COSAG02_NODE_47_length_45434_cov_101.776221_14_plen_500_part_00